MVLDYKWQWGYCKALNRQQSTTEHRYSKPDVNSRCNITPKELLQVNTSTEFLETAALVKYFKEKRGSVCTTLHS